MSPLLDLSIRVLAAAFVGAIIGYEREIRAKGAGMRTHVLVALGSALFMIVSQFGFEGAPRFDAARVAAGVVGGLGFLGGGIIMKTKNHVSGLTTAAGLWVTGSLGLALGCGMYALSGICTVLVLVCLEVLNTVLVLVCLEVLNSSSIKFGDKEINAVFSSPDQDAIKEALTSLGRRVKDYSLSKQENGYKLEAVLHVPKKEYGVNLINTLSSIPGVQLESFD